MLISKPKTPNNSSKVHAKKSPDRYLGLISSKIPMATLDPQNAHNEDTQQKIEASLNQASQMLETAEYFAKKRKSMIKKLQTLTFKLLKNNIPLDSQLAQRHLLVLYNEAMDIPEKASYPRPIFWQDIYNVINGLYTAEMDWKQRLHLLHLNTCKNLWAQVENNHRYPENSNFNFVPRSPKHQQR